MNMDMHNDHSTMEMQEHNDLHMDNSHMGMDHSSMGMDHSSMGMDHSSMGMDMDVSNSGFCSSKMSMVMYMDGFRFGLNSSSNKPCVNLFFPDWTLDSVGKFVGAMIGLIMLAVFTEGISALRLKLNSALEPGGRKKMIVVSFHALQALLGYLLMLATMTYAIELLLSVCFGLAFGYFLFFSANKNVNPFLFEQSWWRTRGNTTNNV